MKKPISLAWFVLISMHLFAFIYQCIEGNIYTADSKEYLAKAAEIWEAKEFSSTVNNPEAYTKRPPVYPFFIAIIKGVFPTPFAILFFQNLLSIFNFYLLFRFLGQINNHIKVNYKVLWLLILFSPAQVIYANLIMAEILFQSFILLFVIYAAKFFWQPNKISGLVLAGIFLSLAMLTKPSVYLLAPVFLFAAIIFAIKYRNLLIVAAGAIPVLIAVSYMFWNENKTGYFHFSSIQHINLLHYNTYYLLTNTNGQEYADKVVDSVKNIADEKQSFKERQKYINETCYKILSDRKLAYLKLHLKGSLNQFLDPGRYDIYTFLGLENNESTGLLNAFSTRGYTGVINNLKQQPVFLLVFLILIAITQVVKLVLFVIFCLRSKIPLNLRILLGGIILFFALTTGPLGASRFAVPVYPVILICCALSLGNFSRKNRSISL